MFFTNFRPTGSPTQHIARNIPNRKPYSIHCNTHAQQETSQHTVQLITRKPISHIATNMPNRKSFHIAKVFAKSDDFPPASNSQNNVTLIERNHFVLQISGQEINITSILIWLGLI